MYLKIFEMFHKFFYMWALLCAFLLYLSLVWGISSPCSALLI